MEQTVERAAARPRLGVDGATVWLVLAIKLGVLLLGALVMRLAGRAAMTAPRDWLAIWNRWDAPHYLDLAQYGYQNYGELRLFLVFYPLYPWLTRLLGWPFGSYLLGAFLVSAIASVVAALLFVRLVQLDEPPAVARLALWFLLIFPTAYFLHIGYTESLFLALSFGCLLAARHDRWLLAGTLGAFASLTRVNGLVLIPALGVEALITLWTTRRWRWQWLWIGLVGLGFAGYLLLNERVAGDPFAFSKIVASHWYKTLTWPWVGVEATLRSVVTREAREVWGIFVPEVVFLALSFAATVATAFWLRPAYAVWMAGNWILFTSTSFILSVPRYSLILFPIMILMAKAAARRPWLAWLLSGVSLAGLVLFATLFLLDRGGY